MTIRAGMATFIIWLLAITFIAAFVHQWLASPSSLKTSLYSLEDSKREIEAPDRKLTIKLSSPPPMPEKPKVSNSNMKKPKKAENKVNSNGSYFSTSLDYRSHLGFLSYIDMIKRLGGRFFLYNKKRQSIIAELDMQSEHLNSLSNLNGLSTRSRIITGELVTSRYEEQGSGRFGPGIYQVIFLWPKSVEDRLQQQYRYKLSQFNLDISDVVELQGIYKPVSGKVYMQFHKIVLTGGKTKAIDIQIEV